MPDADGLSDEDVEGLVDTGAGALLLAPAEGQMTTQDSGDASDRTCTVTASTLAAVDCTTAPL